MSATRDYLDRFARLIADVRICEVVSRDPEGDTYQVRMIDSGAITPAAANRADNWKPKSRVSVEFPAASRNTIGAMPVIRGQAPREQRGVSDTVARSERLTHDAPATIISIDPPTLVLDAGGEPGMQIITGIGFDAAATYYPTGDGDDPALTDAEAPLVTETKVTMTVSADADSPLGTFGINVSGARAKGALLIRPMTSLPRFLFAWTYNLKLLRIDPVTLELLDATDLASGGGEDAIGQIGSTVLAIRDQVGHTYAYPVNVLTGEIGAPIEIPALQNYYAATVGTELWIPRPPAAADILRLSADGSTDTLALPAGFAPYPMIVANATEVWVCDRGSFEMGVGGKVWRYTPSTTAEVFGVLAIATGWNSTNSDIALTDDALWFISEAGSLVKFDRDTLAVLLNIGIVATDTAFLAYSAGQLFACRSDAGDSTVYVVDEETGAFTSIADLPGIAAGWMRGDGTALFVTDTSAGKIARIDITELPPPATFSFIVDPDGVGIGPVFPSRAR